MALSKDDVAKATALMRQGGMPSFRSKTAPVVADLGDRLAFLFIHESAVGTEPTKANTFMLHLSAEAVDEMLASLVQLHAARLGDTKPAGSA